jgi:hypothetical protein
MRQYAYDTRRDGGDTVRYPPWSEAISGQFLYLHCVRNESGSTRTAPACQTSTIRLAHASGATNAEVVCELCCGSQDPHNAFRRNAGHAGCGSFKASTYKEHETKYHGAANCVWNVGRKYVNHMAATEIIMQMAAVLREWINEHARTSRVLGLMIDESTDISNKQVMLLLLRFCVHGRRVTMSERSHPGVSRARKVAALLRITTTTASGQCQGKHRKGLILS